MDKSFIIVMCLQAYLVLVVMLHFLHTRKASAVICELSRHYRESIQGLIKDAMIAGKASSAEESAKAMAFAEHERESIRQQVMDHEAWRDAQLRRNEKSSVPVEDAQEDDEIVTADGQALRLQEYKGRKIAVSSTGEEYDILAGA